MLVGCLYPRRYRDLYYEGGVSSCYLWDLEHGFAGVVLIKKVGDGSRKVRMTTAHTGSFPPQEPLAVPC